MALHGQMQTCLSSPVRRPCSMTPCRAQCTCDACTSATAAAGGGPCGLAAAMYLSQMGWPDIEVWDMLPPPQPSDDGRWGTADRSYNVIVSAKGQAALHELGAYNRVIKCSAPSNYRQEWTPERPEGKLTVYTDDDQNPTPQVLSYATPNFAPSQQCTCWCSRAPSGVWVYSGGPALGGVFDVSHITYRHASRLVAD